MENGLDEARTTAFRQLNRQRVHAAGLRIVEVWYVAMDCAPKSWPPKGWLRDKEILFLQPAAQQKTSWGFGSLGVGV